MMKIDRKTILVYLFVFFVSFLWMYSLTYNFNFFWEDSYIIAENQKDTQNIELAPNLFSLFLGTIIRPEQFYHIDYAWKPLQEMLFNPFFIGVFGLNLTIFRILKAGLFAMLITVFFSFFYAMQNKIPILDSFETNGLNSNNEATTTMKAAPKKQAIWRRMLFSPLLIPILALSYILLLPEFWAVSLYFEDTLMLTIFFATAALAMFYHWYNNDEIQNIPILCALFFLIVFLTDLSIITKHVGRINFLLIFIFLGITNWKKIFSWRYGVLILALFCLSFPILGIPTLFTGTSVLELLGIQSHMGIGTEVHMPMQTLFGFFPAFFNTIYPYGIFLLLLFLTFFLLHAYAILRKKESQNKPFLLYLKSTAIFSLFWYFFQAVNLYVARGITADPFYFLRFQFTLFLVPQLLFVLSYSLFVFQKWYSKKKIWYWLICLFLLFAVIQTIPRLNEWRGGWGAYFLGYDTARQYVDEHATNAVLLVPFDHASPLYFTPPSTNQQQMIVEITNSTLLHSYQKNYTYVFIADRYPLVFDDATIVNIANLTVIDTSPYGILKKSMGRYYAEPIYLYEVK